MTTTVPEILDETLKTEETSTQSPMTNKEINDRKRDTRNYFKDQIELLKPQVEHMELKARFAKATIDNYRYGMELNKIEAGFQEAEAQKAEEEAAVKTNSPEAPVVDISTDTTKFSQEYTSADEVSAVFHQDA